MTSRKPLAANRQYSEVLQSEHSSRSLGQEAERSQSPGRPVLCRDPPLLPFALQRNFSLNSVGIPCCVCVFLSSCGRCAQSPQIQSLQSLHSPWYAGSGPPLPVPVSPCGPPCPSSWLCCPLAVSLRPFLLVQPTSCSLGLGSLFFAQIQRIVNRATTSCPATTKVGSQCKYKDDIRCDFVCFGWFFPNFCCRYCCLPGGRMSATVGFH